MRQPELARMQPKASIIGVPLARSHLVTPAQTFRAVPRSNEEVD